MHSLGIAAALAACMSGVGNGVEALQGMFTPRFSRPDHLATSNGRGKVRRRAHNASTPVRRPHHNSQTGCGAKQCRKYKAQSFVNINRYFDQRMAWLERNAHVLAKRRDDQLKANGRNMIVWGRR